MSTGSPEIHPELRRVRLLPRTSYGPASSAVIRRLRPRAKTSYPGVSVEEITLPGVDGAPGVVVRMLAPLEQADPAPALLWVHGGGHIIGAAEQDDRMNTTFVRELGIRVAAVRYRLGTTTPGPAAVEDAYTALRGLVDHATELRIDPERIAVGGASAGGGIAAGTVLMARDRGEVHPVFQLLVYPMLDDRTATQHRAKRDEAWVWTSRSNHYGWSRYLRQPPGAADVSAYLAPARSSDVRGLPPTWIGVGDLDLFYAEDRDYAARLTDSGTPCRLEIVQGAFHGFDTLFPRTGVASAFLDSQVSALQAGFEPSDGG